MIEQLENEAGVGVILSPRDLGKGNAIEYARSYHDYGAEVLLDPQFYVPDYSNRLLDTYSSSQFRVAVSELRQLTDEQLIDFANALRIDQSEIQADALIAPAVCYEAGRPEIVELNARIFEYAKQIGNDLGIPTYATIVLARSVTASNQTIGPVLSQATALDADGWYFAFEFEEERVPSVRESVRRCCGAILTLACTGKPVLHAYAGPMGLLSFGFGAQGAGVGHSQNLWKFTRDRWQAPTSSGGNNQAPPRFFSDSLWGTIVYPDETVRLNPATLVQVLSPETPFCGPVMAVPPTTWDRWEAGKHLVHALATAFDTLAQTLNARINAGTAMTRLQQAVALHTTIRSQGIALGDLTNVYQENWRLAVSDVLSTSGSQFDYLELLTG